MIIMNVLACCFMVKLMLTKLVDYCATKAYRVQQIIKKCASDPDDRRFTLIKISKDTRWLI
ncbi:hypothetical protein TI03_02730 [Achromatium sp. WMS1]|nr:hypothetical protein TI03_02730 [Achromatium sp. WMS1]